MKAYRSLPQGYRARLVIDLQKDRKTALKVNLGGAAAMLLTLLAGHFIVPVGEVFSAGIGGYLLRLGAVLLAYVAYIALHELTHAAVMKALGGGSVRFGFTGLYAFAGSEEDYFDKGSYICVALAPLILWGIAFSVLAAALPRDWFWAVWFLQAGNIGGAGGDVYVAGRTMKQKKTALIRDTGVHMTMYDK